MNHEHANGAGPGPDADADRDPDIRGVLDDWFLDEETGRHDVPQLERWFRGGRTFDERLRERWQGHLDRAAAGGLSHWRGGARGTLAFVVLLDQFARNIHRGSAAAFAHDALALEAAREAVARGDDRTLPTVQRVFLYLPYEHHESREAQADSLRLFETLQAQAPAELAGFVSATLDSAREHAAIVDRFGRYPHRNAVLGRGSTEQEQRFLDEGGGRFGQ